MKTRYTLFLDRVERHAGRLAIAFRTLSDGAMDLAHACGAGLSRQGFHLSSRAVLSG
ncbi:MAG: hypothetical protein ACREWG_00010 [Gammaproteobacteria bacterium]